MELFPAFNPGEIANIWTNSNKPPKLLCPEGGYLSFTNIGEIACQVSPSKLSGDSLFSQDYPIKTCAAFWTCKLLLTVIILKILLVDTECGPVWYSALVGWKIVLIVNCEWVCGLQK